MIPINKPIYDEQEMNAVNEVIESGNFTVSAYSIEGGQKVREFEDALSRITGLHSSVAVSSGTAALETALLASKVGHGDIVIVPSLTFVATANAVTSVGARSVFCDVDKYGQMDYEKCKVLCQRYSPKAIILVDLYGKISQDAKLFRDLGATVIEDACQALGTPGAGTYGDLACFSFYASKVCTTMGLGGAVVSNSDLLAYHCKIRRNQGMISGDCRLEGRNLLMGEANAAFGIVQLGRLSSFIKQRKSNLNRLGFTHNDISNGYMATILSDDRDEIKMKMNDLGIGAATYYDKPIHHHKLYSGPTDLPNTEEYAETVLNLPVHPHVYPEHIDTMKEILSRYEFQTAL